MSGPAPYDVVVSRAGHDRGKLFMVVGTDGDRLLLCDGKNRKLANPKSKSPRHVRVAETRAERPDGDRQLRAALARAARGAAAKEVGHFGER